MVIANVCGSLLVVRRRALRFIYTPHLNGISTTYYEEGTVVVFGPP